MVIAKTPDSHITKLLPIGSHLSLNPLNLEMDGFFLGALSANGDSIVNFEYNNKVAYANVEVQGVIVSYDYDSSDDDVLYMGIIPDKKTNTLLFVRMSTEFKGKIQSMILIDDI